MATFQLELVTPERVLLSERVRSVQLPAYDGSMGILAGHAPLMTSLQIGQVRVEHENGDLELIATAGGFVEVSKEKVIILADSAERADDIDLARCELAVQRAREALESGAVDLHEASLSLKRATNRLKVARSKQE